MYFFSLLKKKVGREVIFFNLLCNNIIKKKKYKFEINKIINLA